MADLERVRERRQPEVKRSALDPIERRTKPLWRAALATALILVAVSVVWIVARSTNDAHLDAQSAAPGSNPDPIDQLAQAAAAESNGLSRALADVAGLQLSARLTPEQALRVEDIRRRIRQRLENELWQFEHDAESRVAAACRERRFDAAQELAGGLRKELSQRIGSEPLPERMEKEFDLWSADQSQIVRAAREKAEGAYVNALERHCVEKVVPKVVELEARGRWRDAQVLLATDFASDLSPGDEAQLARAGLSTAAVERALSAARKALEPQREALEKDWKSLDLELKNWVETRVEEWKRQLGSRIAFEASDALAAEWRSELARRKLTLEQMPIGWLNLALEAVVKGQKDLALLEKQLSDEDAQKSLERVEDSAAELWRQRRYAEAAQKYEESATDAWRQTVRTQVELRAREARVLEAFLARAAAGLRANEGRNIDLRAGTILFSGKVSAGVDPLTNGFHLALSGGKVRTLALRATAGSDPAPASLASESIEMLASLAPETATDPSETPSQPGQPAAATTLDPKERVARDQLARALLRFREGDPYGAQSALNAGPLPANDPLLHDLETRIAAAVAQQKTSEGEDRARWHERLYLLRREYFAKGNREQARRSAEELLTNGAAALSPEELADVRRMRDELSGEARPSSEQAIANAFNPSEPISFVGPNKSRVHLVFTFSGKTAGAFSPGDWTADGRSWSTAYAAKSDDEMLSRPAPTLLLGDYFRVQTDDIDVRVKFEQPADSKADLLLISIAGFQIVFVGANNGRPARCHVDTLNADQVVQAARQGAGKEFAGLKSGDVHELGLKVNRTRGTVLVELDGKRIPAEFKPRPRSDPSTASLSIRSFEPIRLMQVTVECTRR
jgi:hypothetical protein